MSKSLRVLVVDDSEDDARLVLLHLKRAGYEVASAHVDTEAGMRDALAREPWDAVVCDYSMPGFGALAAVGLARALGLDLPFIVVSGAVGEESAAECMRAGVHDFVLKGNLARLGPAIEREITEARHRRQLRASEEALRRNERLRSLGQMAAGIAHDLRNICNPISLNLQLAERALARPAVADALEAVGAAREAVKRGVQVVDRLRDFSRQTPDARLEPVDLNRVAEEALALAKPRLSEGAGHAGTLHAEPGAPPVVAACTSELVSAVLNLVINALDAMSGKGAVTVRTGEARGGGWLAVSDTGPGMPPEVREHMYEPFFTTKGEAGTGLGLAMVYATVVRYGGTIDLKTWAGEGTTFTLWFPAWAGVDATATAAAATTAAR